MNNTSLPRLGVCARAGEFFLCRKRRLAHQKFTLPLDAVADEVFVQAESVVLDATSCITELRQSNVASGILTLTGSNSYQLAEDVSVSSTIDVNGTVTLDLNGNTLRTTGSGPVIRVNSGSNLTLIDSGSGGTIFGGNCTAQYGAKINLCYFEIQKTDNNLIPRGACAGGVVNHGTFTINGGTISSSFVYLRPNTVGYIYYKGPANTGTVHANGGQIDGLYNEGGDNRTAEILCDSGLQGTTFTIADKLITDDAKHAESFDTVKHYNGTNATISGGTFVGWFLNYGTSAAAHSKLEAIARAMCKTQGRSPAEPSVALWTDVTIPASATGTIESKAVATPTVTVAAGTYTYNGAEHRPTVTVKDGSTVIPASEYIVNYSNNVNAGTATVTVTDRSGGNYAITTATETFTIAKRAVTLTSADNTKFYDGTAITNGGKIVTISGSGMAINEEFDFEFTASQTAIGSCENKFTAKDSATAKLANYSITCDYGTLTVTVPVDVANAVEGITPDNVTSADRESIESALAAIEQVEQAKRQAVKTGDESMPLLWLALAATATAALPFAAKKRK